MERGMENSDAVLLNTVLLDTVLFDTDINGLQEIEVYMHDKNDFVVGDIGFVHYKIGSNNKITLVKFEREGKSASLLDPKTGELCQNCGAVLCYDKFSIKTACKYCSLNVQITPKEPIPVNDEKKLLRKISIFLMTIFWPMLLLAGVLAFITEYEYSGDHILMGVLFSVLVFGSTALWYYSLPKIKIRAIVENRSELRKQHKDLDDMVGDLTLILEGGRRETYPELDEKHIWKLQKNDVGYLYCKTDNDGSLFFVKFERLGKSATAERKGTSEKCHKCGANIVYDKFSTKIICTYCKSEK